MKVANEPQLSLTLLTNHLHSLLSPKTQQDYSWPSIPQSSALNHQHHYMISIFSISSDLHHTLVIGYQCYQSSDFDIGDYSSLFYFYPLTPMHVIPYCSFLSFCSHAHPMTQTMSQIEPSISFYDRLSYLRLGIASSIRPDQIVMFSLDLSTQDSPLTSFA